MSSIDSLNRRDCLKWMTASAAAVACGGSFAKAAEPAGLVPIIDTHQHLWDLTRFKLPWLGTGDGPIQKSFLMSDYLTAARGMNVVKTIYMEVDVTPEQHEAEADYVLDLCQRDDNPMAGAVISGRPASPEFEAYIRKYAGNKYLKGVRQVLPGNSPGYCVQPQFVKSVQLLGELGLRYDLCGGPEEMPNAIKLVDLCPKTQFVIDHCGNMSPSSTDQKQFAAWEAGMQELAKRPNTICKISGIVASAKPDWKPADLAPIINASIQAFGEDRVMYASDWPVCTLRASFAQWVLALKEIVKDRSPEFQKKLFHDNAARFYGV